MSPLTQEGHLLGKQTLNMDKFAANWDGEQNGSSMWYANSCEETLTASSCNVLCASWATYSALTSPWSQRELKLLKTCTGWKITEHTIFCLKSTQIAGTEMEQRSCWFIHELIYDLTWINYVKHMLLLLQHLYIAYCRLYIIFIPHKAWMGAHGIYY